jgi:hypothetical protein
LAALALLGAAVWFAPALIVLTDLRDRPLEAIFAGGARLNTAMSCSGIRPGGRWWPCLAW